jgi:hypothetical protein
MTSRSFFRPGTVRDSIYSAIRDHPRGAELKVQIESMWRRYEAVNGDDSEHFLTDARGNFHARAWEMYLGCTLMDRGFVLTRPPRSGPDILVQWGSKRLWVEATTTESGTGPDAVPELPNDGDMHLIEHDPRMLRYSAAIRAKQEQWRDFVRRGLVAPDDPYVIAVNGSRLSTAGFDSGPIPDIVRTVFGLGEPQYPWLPDAQTFGPPRFPRRGVLSKRSGASVPIEFFASRGYECISGVFFSATAPWDAISLTGNDVLFVHNHNARTPLERETFRFGLEWWFNADDETVRRRDWRARQQPPCIG